MVNVVVAGKNNIAVDILSELIERVDITQLYVVFNESDSGVNGFQRSFKKYCESVNVIPITLSDAESLNNSIFLSLEFDKIVKPQNFKSKKLFNIHFSLLPKYKGMYTSAWPILNHDKETGVTLHEIDAGIDTGKVIDQCRISIDESDTAKDLYIKYIEYGTKLVKKNIDSLIKGEFTSSHQSSKGSTYFSKNSIDYGNVEVELKDTAYNIKKKIQAFTFRDYQLIKLKGYEIYGAEVLGTTSSEKPGTTLQISSRYIDISTIDYDLRLYIDTFPKLLEACSEGNIEVFLDLVNKFNVNDKNTHGWSPIIVAAYNGHLNLVKILLHMGASINDTNINGTSVLMYAKDYAWVAKDIEFFNFMIRAGANIEHKDYSGRKIVDYLNNEQIEFFGL